MHAVVTGGAGFLGSHLVRRLLRDDWTVTVVDDLSIGSESNMADLDVSFVRADVRTIGWNSCDWSNLGPVDVIWHLASPCSPPDYQARRIDTLLINGQGTRNALEMAEFHGARFILASTSEVYGDPLVHPQPEDYYGNVSPVGPRSCYDEGKRYAEALTMAYAHERGLDVRVARLFNTYGPRMANDGRVVMRWLTAALAGEPLEVFGDGEQTRSFCYVSDVIDGLMQFAGSDLTVCNVGSDDEITMLDLAEVVLEVTGSNSKIVHRDLPQDDPVRRRPDLMRLRSLGWEQKTFLLEGLLMTARWCRETAGLEERR